MVEAVSFTKMGRFFYLWWFDSAFVNIEGFLRKKSKDEGS